MVVGLEDFPGSENQLFKCQRPLSIEIYTCHDLEKWSREQHQIYQSTFTSNEGDPS
jgi:hypothetical protein